MESKCVTDIRTPLLPLLHMLKSTPRAELVVVVAYMTQTTYTTRQMPNIYGFFPTASRCSSRRVANGHLGTFSAYLLPSLRFHWDREGA
jgi:hypothetical protein